MIKDYARLRYSLLPYIYSTAHAGTLTGMPIMRAMPLMFPNDPALADSTREYMLGEYLLVTAFTPHVRFPAGRWIDYWTGKEYRGPAELAYTIPENRGGGLFIRAGAILPYWPAMDYVGQKPVETLSLHFYPEGQSQFTLYEDDGLSLGYRKGEFAQTEITSQRKGSEVAITIAPRQGAYAGEPQKRAFDVYVHTAKPQQVTLNGKPLSQGPQGWQFDASSKVVRLKVEEDSSRKKSKLIAIH